MTRHSPGPEKVPPGQLLLRTGGPCGIAPEHLLHVFGTQRQRFAAALRGFGPDDWAGPTRCADWSAHDVVRHLCDCNAIAAGTDDRALDLTAGFDPRITPRGWPAVSASQSPGASFSRFLATTHELLALLRDRLAQGLRFDVRLPYGPMDWTILVLHAFWDSWLHERDVLLARGREHPTDGDATICVPVHDFCQQFRRAADPHRRAVLHRHGVHDRRVRRYHPQVRGGAARGHRPDGPRSAHSRDLGQNHPRRGDPRTPAPAGRCQYEAPWPVARADPAGQGRRRYGAAHHHRRPRGWGMVDHDDRSR